ncbi:PRC and DUF2382 domain-containing protein [Actinomadura syzygii]|uniref:DUF2382 domain-containing protein n=1 Tax=Actinomadura syzygii TaxID=1427538 RepID=A0A5D0UCM3_9ACTN|nr:PRC and DUF2382 domain-containing protein [Actinomadura syzygii]TYC15365.1 DUF2382 domain-containing protein [Actinomadura syzygii]
MQTQTQVRELMGMGVTDTNGTKVGTIKQVYLNDDSGSPEWVTVHTGWFGMRESFVPLSGSRKAKDMLQVPYDKETIKGAPNVDADEHLSHAQIVDLYRHYGVRPPGGARSGEAEGGGTGERTGERRTAESEGRTSQGLAPEGKVSEGRKSEGAGGTGTGTERTSGTDEFAGTRGSPRPGAAGMAVHPERDRGGRGMPAQSPRTGAETDTPMTEITRSEERLRVGTERHESGHVHVRKWIETETVERTVPVSHDELKVDREPIRDGRPAPEVSITSDDLDFILYEERPVIAKETVPVERVRLHTEQVQDEQTVRGELRRERIEVTRDDAFPDREPGRDRGPEGGRGGPNR